MDGSAFRAKGGRARNWQRPLIAAALAALVAARAPAGPSPDPRDYKLSDTVTIGLWFPDRTAATLGYSACVGDVAAMKMAISAGADPNSRGKDGTSLLSLAILCNNAAGVGALLEAHADPNYMTPYSKGDPAKWIPPQGGVPEVVFAAYSTNPEILPLVLAHGGDPNATDFDGIRTALTRAMDFGVRGHGWQNYDALLAAGADINRESGKRTIADHAAMGGRFDRLLDLLDRGYHHNLALLAVEIRDNRYPPRDQQDLQRKALEVVERRLGESPKSAK